MQVRSNTNVNIEAARRGIRASTKQSALRSICERTAKMDQVGEYGHLRALLPEALNQLALQAVPGCLKLTFARLDPADHDYGQGRVVRLALLAAALANVGVMAVMAAQAAARA
eukprot:3377292-Prymnesium_polylepis.1